MLEAGPATGGRSSLLSGVAGGGGGWGGARGLALLARRGGLLASGPGDEDFATELADTEVRNV
jgi:hypothetical protein